MAAVFPQLYTIEWLCQHTSSTTQHARTALLCFGSGSPGSAIEALGSVDCQVHGAPEEMNHTSCVLQHELPAL